MWASSCLLTALHRRAFELLQVDWANKSDFKFFDWKWTEGEDYTSPAPKDTRDGDAYSRSP